MNKHIPILTTGILLVSWAITCRSLAQTYNANAAFQAHELALSEDNSSFPPFSAGYAENFGEFNAFTAGEHTNAFAGDGNTQGFITLNNVIVPAVVVNVSDTNPGAFGLAPREILLHPGGRGPDGFVAPFFDGVLRFTAPAAGFYTVAGNFRSIAAGITENTILHNAATRVSITDEGPFNFSLQLAAGDFIDFSVGAGPDGIGSDSTGLTATLTVGAPPAPRQNVNIDFNGKRPGDADSAGTFVGSGAAGGGTVFNGLTADSTGGNDNLTVSGTDLLSDTGAPTTIDFTIGPVGGDHEPSQGSEPASLYDDYVFNNSAGNITPGGSPFTISGLGDATTADLYFYGSFGSQAFIVNGAPTGGIFGIYNSLSATAFFDVPVTAGTITGLFGVGQTGVLGGLTVSAVPEPATATLLGVTALAAAARRRRVFGK